MAQPATAPTATSTNPTPPPSEQQTAEIKQEPQLSSPIESPAVQSPESPPLPNCINSITELRSFSDALSTFYRCYDDLQTHLDSIKSAIDAKLARQIPPVASLHSQPNQIDEKKPAVARTAAIPTSAPIQSQEVEVEEEKVNTVGHASSEVENLCASMSSRCLRRYILTNLGDSDKLREEVPKALKFAPKPAKLVLECVGRFFLQGSKAYTPNSPMITAREASILTLECFLLMEREDDAVKIDKIVKQEAEESAKSWRKRLMSEGGLAKACEIDARGLLLFLGCFGVPAGFRFDDISDLVNAGNVKAIVSVLKRSKFLMEKITDAIEGLAKNRMGVDAVDMAYTFELQDKITPQPILASFLRDAKETWKRAKKSYRDSPSATNDANKRQLAALRSLVKCVERHDIDVARLVPGWQQVHETISSLEKNIADFDKNNIEKALQKRKAEEMDSSRNSNNLELKRLRHTIHGLPQQRLPASDGHRNLLDRTPSHRSSSLASPSMLHGTVSSLLPESIPGSAVGIGGSRLTSAYVGGHGETLVDLSGRIISYGSQRYGLHGDVAYEDRLVAQYAGQHSSLGLTSLYRTSASMERFAGLPSSSALGVATRSSVSDLYQFADAVGESDSYTARSARPVGSVPSADPSHHHSSYLY